MDKQHGPITGWSQSGPLTTGKGINGGKGQSVSLQAKLSHPDSLTVQFNLSGPKTGRANCRANISATVEGNEVNRIVTVMDGASITLRGQVINVEARDFTDPAIDNDNNYNVEILATLGVRAGNKQPPILNPLVKSTNFGSVGVLSPIVAVIVVPALGTTFVPIPNDAGVISAFVTVISDGTAFTQDEVLVQHYTTTGTVLRDYDPRNYDWVPLTPTTGSLGLKNNQAAAKNALFAVTFGVDG